MCNELYNGMTRHLDDIMRESFPALHERFLEVNDNFEVANDYEEIVERYVNAINVSIENDIMNGSLFNDLCDLVDQIWVEKKLSEGIELNTFNDMLKDVSYAGDVYHVMFGTIESDEFEENERMLSWVFDTLENALKFVRKKNYIRHVNIVNDYIEPNDDCLLDIGPSRIVYPPHTNGNPRSEHWMMYTLSGWKYINEDGSVSPLAITWRQLADCIKFLPQEVMDLPALVNVAEDVNEGIIPVNGLSAFDACKPIGENNPPSIDLTY